jgi:septal ring factor EnvC (AmiA/AmiB activator)
LELDANTVTSFALGLATGVVMLALLTPALKRRIQVGYQQQLSAYEQTVADLRQERAADRETNRRLRHDLAVNTPQNLEATRHELDTALADLAKVNADLERVADQLSERDRSLREARLAIQDIRLQLERGNGQHPWIGDDGRVVAVDEPMVDR